MQYALHLMQKKKKHLQINRQLHFHLMVGLQPHIQPDFDCKHTQFWIYK